MNCLHHYDNGRDAPEVWNRIRNNDPSLTDLVIDLFGTPTPSFYQNLAKDLQDNSNITHLTINGDKKKYIPNGMFDPIFESSKFIKTLVINSLVYEGNEMHAMLDDIFDSLIKSKNNKITKLKIFVEENIVEPLTKFLSTNIENQMLKLILQQKMGAEAASKISDELLPPNSIKELKLALMHRSTLFPESGVLLDTIGNNRSLESLCIDIRSLDPEDFDFELTIALVNILSNSKALKKLHLTINKIDRKGIKKIAMAIQKSPSLESFEFHTRLRFILPNTAEHIEDEIRKYFAKISNKLLLTKSCGYLDIKAYGYKKIKSKCVEKGKH